MPSILFYAGYIMLGTLALGVFVFLLIRNRQERLFRPLYLALTCSGVLVLVLSLIVFIAHKDTRRCQAVIAPLLALDSENADAMVINAFLFHSALGKPGRGYQQWVDKRILRPQVLAEGVDYTVIGQGLSAQYLLSRRAAEHLAVGTNIANGCLSSVDAAGVPHERNGRSAQHWQSFF